MNMKYYLFLVLFALLFSCKQDDEVMAPCNNDACPTFENECLPFELWEYNVCLPNSQPSGDPCDYYANYDTLNYYAPTFNPQNSNELGFVSNKYYNTWGGGFTSTCCLKYQVYNHQSNTKLMEFDIPYDLRPSSPPDWSVNDVLIYSAVGNSEIYSLDLNSGAITYIMDGSRPIWSPSGDYFLFTTGTFSDVTVQLADLNGEILDTISEIEPELIISDWSNSNKLLYDWSYWDFENNEGHTHEFPDDMFLGIFFQKWGATDEEITLVGNDYGIGSFNIFDETYEVIKPNCSGKYFGQIDVSPDKKFIATNTRKYSILDSDTLYINQQLRVMDVDGSCEHIIDIEPY